MKKSILACWTICLVLLSALSLQAQQLMPLLNWHQGKFSLFIHYGLYSEAAGYWNGEKVEQGYSEQIYSFASLSQDDYAKLLPKFKTKKWNAEDIVALAQKAGMKSVVMTAKHHDGFCLYRSAETDYNVYDATPAKRDLMAELAKACRDKGMHFGVYFSLIDWHFPEATPLSPHNADFITPAHHQYNLRQVEEILTRYGKISELWFDMGSLSEQQSRELYELVHRLQPDCMVSGRLGNDFADFAVMGDNELPNEKLTLPWQTAASVYPETWGYRAWQERGSVEDKAKEKIDELIKVVARGGNYLLNIGPRGDGAVIPFERELLEQMGSWMERYGEGLYATEPSPFAEIMPCGEFTHRGNTLYFYLRRDHYGKTITLPINGDKLDIVSNLSGANVLHLNVQPRYVQVKVDPEVKFGDQVLVNDNPYILISFEFFDEDFLIEKPSAAAYPLHVGNAERRFAHSSWDYYSGFKSITAMNWLMPKLPKKIAYSKEEQNRRIHINVDGKAMDLLLDKGQKQSQSVPQEKVKLHPAHMRRVGGVFGKIPDALLSNEPVDLSSAGWEPCPEGAQEREASQISSLLLLQEIDCQVALTVPCRLYYGNGVYITLNGKPVNALLQRNPTADQELLLLLPLEKGKNRLLVRYFNRFEDKLRYGISWDKSYEYYTMPLPESLLQKAKPSKLHRISVEKTADELAPRPLNAANLRFLE